MEQSDSSQSGLTGARVTLLAFCLLAGALAVRHFSSGLTRAAAANRPFAIAMLTNPPALAEIAPDKGRVRFSIIREPAGMAKKSPHERAVPLLSAAQQAYCGAYYFQPADPNPSAAWDAARDTALNYRARPRLAVAYLKNYFSALFSGRTNIAPDEFYIITSALASARTDAFISVLNYSPQEDRDELSGQPGPDQPDSIVRTLTIEVLNGSGESGMALKATKYLRSLAGPDFRVDVLRHDNSPGTNKTRFIAYTGREDDIAKLGARLGLAIQIDSAHSDIGDTDARLILGKDFKLPQ
ncbi:MAG: LytR C-terminal domain-containing protein [Elusimicrobiaceae bacterium]|nr:LytR C-terminal domain-containing protein [Elusimicrobiaceae bacterium]